MGTIFEVDNDGIMYLGTQSSDPTSHVAGNLWYNTTDKKLRVSTGDTIVTMGDEDATEPWYLSSTYYDVYDDFDSYSTGTFATNSKWDIATVNTGQCNITASTTAGGTTNELQMYQAVSAGGSAPEISAIANAMTDNLSVWARLWIWQVKGSGYNNIVRTSYAYVTVDGGTTWTTIYTGGVYSNLNVKTALQVLIVALGDDKYDVYCGGKKLASEQTASPLEFGVRFLGVNTTFSTGYAYMYMDDVRQLKG